MIEKPVFKEGNVAFAKALNEVADYAEKKGVNAEGMPDWSETLNGWRPPYATAGTGTFECKGFIASVDASTGDVTMSASTVEGGENIDFDSTFLTPSDPSSTAAASGTTKIWVKVSYTVSSSSVYGSRIEVDDVEFTLSATRPSDTLPSWSGSAWSPTSCVRYSEWGTIVDRVVTACNGGGIHLKACTPDSVDVTHYCAI